MARMRRPGEDFAAGDGEEREDALVPRVVGGLRQADETLVAFVQERPLVAVGAALAVGYVLGRVLPRVG